MKMKKMLKTKKNAPKSLLPLCFGFGLTYGVAAATGGGFFLWCSWQLFLAPSRSAAMKNFGASLVQLLLLLAGIITDGAFR
jgi:protoheme IX farnesyltransferase